MANQWGRRETIIWPPHVPILSYTALATALLCTCFFIWQRLNFSLAPLQKSYITEYLRSQVGSTFKAHQSYHLLYVGDGKTKVRLALPADFTDGITTLPNGKTLPVTLSEVAKLQGYRWFFRGPTEKLADTSLHRWLGTAVYEQQGVLRLFDVSLIEGVVCLAVMLWFAVPRDIRRFKQMKYGRILRGPQMLSPKEFNKQQKGDGIGFKTTELGKMMRIPLRKEAQHFQIMGDTGVGKTQLIMQILRQIRERGDSAIIYDPACEYLQRFYDSKRGDVVLNPLDERCPYWGPAQEMASNAEADAIAASLYQPATDVKDEFFHQTPAQIFAHLLKKGPTAHQLAEWMANSDTLETLVAGTEMSFYIDRKAGPQRAGVLASLGLVAKCFRILPEKAQTNGTWNARTWAKERKGWVFITSRPAERETLRPLHSLWIDLLVMRLLTAPQPGQKPVWFVIDELASLQKLPQLHTAITENRKSKNPLVLGFQGKAQLEVIYGHLAEVMLSQPATKIFMKTAEPKASEWISEAIGKVEIERLKETKFDGSRSGKNFTVDRQIEPLVMGSEISGLDDRHAYLKLGNLVARFDFDYLDLPTPTPGFLARKSPDGEMSFDPDTLKPRRPITRPDSAAPFAEPPSGTGAPLTHKREPEIALAEQEIQSDRSSIAESPIAPAELEPVSDLQDQIDLHDSLGGHQHAVHSGIF
jgi:type IV secretory pathway TraG/TraD family ATPase VirD4